VEARKEVAAPIQTGTPVHVGPRVATVRGLVTSGGGVRRGGDEEPPQ
jgi:hypothetical protein